MTAARRTPSDEVAGSLVDAAIAVLEADGPAALTVRRVAADAHVSPQSVYNRFGGKQGVVDAVFVAGFDGLRDAFADLAATDPLAVLVEGAHRYRDLAHRHPAIYAVMFDRAVPGYLPTDEAKAHARAAFDELASRVQDAMDAGGLRPGDAVGVAQQLWSSCHGAVSLELRGLGFVDDVDAQYADLVDSTLRGLAP